MVAVESLTGVLLKCRSTRNLQQAKRLHAHMRELNLESHPILGNFLVSMLVDCGCLPDAQHVFDQLPSHQRNEHSCTSLIVGYIDHHNPQYAFHLYTNMQAQPEYVQPNLFTYLPLLGACSSLRDAEKGQALHAEIIKKGFEEHLFTGSSVVGNALVAMYSKSGLLPEAIGVFDRLKVRNAISWNALISGYTEHGLAMEAAGCFQKMELEGIAPTLVTYLCSLKACGTIASLEIGRHVYGELTKRGFESDLYVGSTLIDVYSKCGALADTRNVFDRLPGRNAVSWAAMIAGYAEYGLNEDVLSSFKQMQLEGISPEPSAFVCFLKACQVLDVGQRIHAELTKMGLEKDPTVSCTVLDMYARCSSQEEVGQVCQTLPARDARTWVALITGNAKIRHGDHPSTCFNQLLLERVSPDASTFLCGLKAVGTVGAGHEMHAEITKSGLEKDGCLGMALMELYIKNGVITEAHSVFDHLPTRHSDLWASLILGYAKHGPDEEVLKCFEQMQLVCDCVDPVILICGLKACGNMGALERGREIHAKIRTLGLERDLFVGSILVDMYGKCGSVHEGWKVFDKMPVRDVVSWTAMIKVCGENHEGRMAILCFENMQKQGVNPNSTTFTCLLAACSHDSLVSKGQEFYKMMEEEYQIEPTLDHYACMVDLFGRSGHIHEAEKLISTMKCPPSTVILMTMLSACKVYGKVELGEQCFQQLVGLNEEVASACLLMKDIYASANRWRDSKRIEKMRKAAGMKKKLGGALIEVQKELHEFNKGLNHSEAISRVLGVLFLHMKDLGYVPQAYM